MDTFFPIDRCYAKQPALRWASVRGGVSGGCPAGLHAIPMAQRGISGSVLSVPDWNSTLAAARGTERGKRSGASKLFKGRREARRVADTCKQNSGGGRGPRSPRGRRRWYYTSTALAVRPGFYERFRAQKPTPRRAAQRAQWPP